MATRKPYNNTVWINDVTKLNARNMNNIEEGIVQHDIEIANILAQLNTQGSSIAKNKLAIETNKGNITKNAENIVKSDRNIAANKKDIDTMMGWLDLFKTMSTSDYNQFLYIDNNGKLALQKDIDGGDAQSKP